MAKKDRTGKRKRRPRHPSRNLELGYYILVTDAKETEKNYFEGFRDSLPSHARGKLVIKVIVDTDIKDIVERCEEAYLEHPQCGIPWLIIDRDKVVGFDALVTKAEKRGISVGWSNPCIETWFHCYFENPIICDNSTTCIGKFKTIFHRKTGNTYEKASSDIYRHLSHYGDEKAAVSRAEQRLTSSISDGQKIVT